MQRHSCLLSAEKGFFMTFKKALIASTAAMAALAATPAHAALVEGVGFWYSTAPTTSISAPSSQFLFSFEVDEPLEAFVPATFSNFTFTLNGSPIASGPDQIVFIDSGLGGGFDVIFPDVTLNIFSEDFTAMPGDGFYLFDAQVNLDGNVGVGGVTITYNPVPEASTWAMMILGLGFAGAALRRRSETSVRVTYA
jgi:hypothetical protein